MKNLIDYLRELRKKQGKILLLSRLSTKHSWADRCYFLDEKYVQTKHYNHRNILYNEVVIEFDDEEVNKNLVLATEVGKRLAKDHIRYSLWHSGNKSYHIHTFIDHKDCKNIRLLKKVFMRYYTRDFDIKPDMRLAVDGHLIRAEYGIHEKSGVYKTLIKRSPDALRDNEVSSTVWGLYSKGVTTVIRRGISQDLAEVDKCTCVKYLSDSTLFRENEDGRERALFILIHALKKKHSKEDLKTLLIDWYKYSGGYKLVDSQIEGKVNYHYHRNYGIYTMLVELLEDLGKEEVMKTCPVHKGVKNG